MPPTGLKGGALARARTNARAMMQDTCTIRGTTGTPTRAIADIATNVPCRITQMSPSDWPVPALAEITMPVVTFKIMLPYNTALAKDYQIVLNGHTYEVWSFADDQTPLIYKTAFVRRLTS